ncbi:hypothetical protein Sjap_022814 [Stephania japonica]|uniref:FAD dependent oxidoreductase domain-containing protein n=1 Tax=Stephania japonica TaxID=461633 RepID=A0AAP0HTZ3_9MAGN
MIFFHPRVLHFFYGWRGIYRSIHYERYWLPSLTFENGGSAASCPPTCSPPLSPTHQHQHHRLLLRFNVIQRTTASAAESGGVRRRSDRSLHGLLPLPQGRLRDPPREILPRLRRLRKVRRLPRPRLVRVRPPLRPLPRQLPSPPLPRPRSPRPPILRLPPPPHPHPHPHPPPSPSPSRPSAVPGWVDGPATDPREIGTPETTAQLHPQLFTRKLVSVAEAEHGLEVVIGELDHVAVDGGGGTGTATGAALKDGRLIAADAVVLALGPWSGRLSVLSSLFRVYGLKAHSIVLEPRDPSVITPHALFLNYYSSRGGRPLDPEVYPRPSGEVYVCGMSSEAQVPDDPEEILGDVESIKVLKRVAGTVSSHLKEGEARVKAEQACFLPCTDDSKPVIGEVPGVRRCYVATGHSCWGILNGPATGAAMAELILDGKSSIVDITPFSPARFVGGGSARY